jgi:hypothetical protein
MTKHDDTPGVGREFLWGLLNSVVVSAVLYAAAAYLYLFLGGMHSVMVEVSGYILLFTILIVPLGMILWGVLLQPRETTGQAMAIKAELKGPVPVVDTPEDKL